MNTLLQNSITSYLVDVSENELTDFWGIGKTQSIDEGEFFVREGQIPGKFGFVISGMFRYCYIDKNGKEFTKAFMTERSFISSYSAMVLRKPSHFYIEALEDSVVFEIEYRKWNMLREKNSRWDKLLIGLLEKGYAVKEKRERELLLLDAESRYKLFLQEFPTLERRVKQFMIASYLGITPIALSRVRKKLGIINLG